MFGASEDDMRLLLTKRFVLPLGNNGLVVIKHWKINNSIRTDRYKPSNYRAELEQYLTIENHSYKEVTTNGTPNDNQWYPQDRIGKDSIGKYRLDKDSIKIETDRNDKSNLSLPEKLFEKLLECEYANILDKEEYIELFKDLLANYEVKDIKTKLYYFIDCTCELHYDYETKRAYYKLEKPITSTYPYFEKSIRLALEKQ